MSLKKRERRTAIGNISVNRPHLSLDQSISLVIAAKKVENLRERTLKDYEKLFGYFKAWLAEHHSTIDCVHDIDLFIARDYINYLRYDARRYDGHKFINAEEQRVGLTDTTVNIRLRTLKAIFNQLERDKHIEANPFASVKLLRQDVDLTNCFTDDEVKTILSQPDRRDYVGFRDYVAIVLLLDGGFRCSELLGLRASDIDFQTRFITLSGDRSKNRKPRMIPVSVNSIKLLLQLIEENRKHFTTDRIFLSCYGDPIGQNHFNKQLKYYSAKAGISDKKMTSHVWRHTWAKNMIVNGSDPFTLQKMGGWADIRTMRRYIQMDTEDMRRSHDEYSPTNKFIKKRV